MASHALLSLARYANCFRNIGQIGLYQKLSTSQLQCNMNVEEAAKLKEPELKDVKKVLKDPSELQHEEALNGYIIVPADEQVGIISGIPEEHIKTRLVRIYRPAKNAMQSGTNNTNFWQIEFDTRERWENPLIGWISTGDPMSNLTVDFASKEEAIQHCKKMGWECYVQNPDEDKPRPRTYGTNFSWNKLTRVSTK